MIPYQAALLLYIPLAAMIMMGRNSALCFSLAYLGGLMYLPSGLDLEVPQLPDLTKVNVPAIGILIGTILFHPRLFERYRLTMLDMLFFFGMGAAFITAYLNDMGARFGASLMVETFLSFMLPVALARIHLGTPASLRIFCVTLVLLSIPYAAMAAWEFRMSPQLHTWTYGYFQHVFQQHARGGFWRPIVFFYHALALGRFFAFATFLAIFVVRKDLVKLLGPWGNWAFLAPGLGLLVSQSLSPMIMFVGVSGLYLLIQRAWWAVWVLPTVALLWLGFSFANIEIGYQFFDRVGVNQERADSFGYRLDAIREYKSVILNRPWFGHGGFGHGRIEGRATDSQILILLLASGVFGAAAYLAWWLGAMHGAARTMNRMRGTPLASMAGGFAAFASLGLAISVVDAALDPFMMFGLAALYQIHTWLLARPEAERLPKRLLQERLRARSSETVGADA